MSEEEAKCIENCAKKLFNANRAMIGYIPTRVAGAGELTENVLVHRIENPYDKTGPYFEHSD